MSTVLRRTSVGLYAVEEASDERAIQRDLEKRGRHLFLDKEFNDAGELMYSVKQYRPDHEPLDVVYWTDDYGRPMPLTSAILDKLDSLRKEVAAPARERIAEARAERERVQQADAEYERAEMIREHQPRLPLWMGGKGRIVPPPVRPRG